MLVGQWYHDEYGGAIEGPSGGVSAPPHFTDRSRSPGTLHKMITAAVGGESGSLSPSSDFPAIRMANTKSWRLKKGVLLPEPRWTIS